MLSRAVLITHAILRLPSLFTFVKDCRDRVSLPRVRPKQAALAQGPPPGMLAGKQVKTEEQLIDDQPIDDQPEIALTTPKPDWMATTDGRCPPAGRRPSGELPLVFFSTCHCIDVSGRPRGFEARLTRAPYALGDYSAGGPPLPIPNRAVKPRSADGTGPPAGRVGRRRATLPRNAAVSLRRRRRFCVWGFPAFGEE